MNNSQKIFDFYVKKEILLENSLSQFVESVLYFPQIGVELEFYLLDKNLQRLQSQSLVDDYIYSFLQLVVNDDKIYKVEKEQGISQIEIKIAPHDNLLDLAKKILNIKEVAKNLAQKNQYIACFDAQPFIDDCGSALQFNFSLHDIDGSNLFAKKIEQKLMMYSIAGMIDSIDWAMVFYAPQEKDYLRFNKEINHNLHKKGKFTAPVNISYGYDNRTAAIRVPYVKKDVGAENNIYKNARIEFRVPSANADPFLVMTSLLIAISHAISVCKLPQDSHKVFGNAFDEKYLLQNFADNLQIAENNFLNH